MDARIKSGHDEGLRVSILTKENPAGRDDRPGSMLLTSYSLPKEQA
jgi:hypothetical protein